VADPTVTDPTVTDPTVADPTVADPTVTRPHESAGLRGHRGPLTEGYDVAMLDLDGVVYVGADAVPGVPEALAKARQAGMRLTFVTNNAARTTDAVAHHLTELGIEADADEVVNSAQVAAHYLADHLPAGSTVLVIGGEGLYVALRDRGLHPVASASQNPVAVVQGYSPDVGWAMLAEGSVAIRAGALWVATNLDSTVPSPRGPLPGNGSMVAALRHATGVTPISTGKPDPTMHRETVERSGAQAPLVVGDRLDTDIEGASAVGCDSILVLSGVTNPIDLLTAPLHHRPTYLGRDVSALLFAHPDVTTVGDRTDCVQFSATVSPSTLTLSSTTGRSEAVATVDGLDPLRALCGAAWSADPEGTRSQPWTCVGADEAAVQALTELHLI
jgi:glycerol 3-phosphatase-2